MTHLEFDGGRRKLPFYLAMEEVAARRYVATHGDLLFTWQVAPTVICGCHQDVAAEVDLAYCRSAAIDVVRRRSGGGAVFANLSNVMISYICRDNGPLEEVFGRYTTRVASLLRKLGVDAESGSRNDVTISGRKVSGGAFYHTPGAYIAHSTMLIDTDLTQMERTLTPSRAKLESKGIRSVASRVTTLREHLPGITPEDFRRHAAAMCDLTLKATPGDILEAERIEQSYRAPGWLLGGRRGRRHSRVDRAGDIWIDVSAPQGIIESVGISGDFFATGDVAAMCSRLKGTALNRRAVETAIGTSPVAGLTAAELAETIINSV